MVGPTKTSVWALFVASITLGLFTSVALRQVGVPGVGFAAFLIVSVGWFVIVASGALAQKILPQTGEDGELTFAVSAGIVLSSMAVLGLCELFQITAATGVVVFGIVVAFLLWWFRRHFTRGFSGAGGNMLVVPCCGAFVLMWCWSSLTSVGEMPKTGTISLWTDIFIHATTILQYGDFWTSGRGNIEFVNATRPLYHYGSYVLPAALLSVIDISGLQAVVALHLPSGLLAMFAGTYALAKRTAVSSLAQITGFFSICLLFIVPDTSTYGLANGWFGVRWMLLSSPGSSYAIAGVLISLIFLKRWLDDRHYVALASAAAFAAMVFQLRAHMLLWYLPAFALVVVFGEQKWAASLRKRAGLCATVLLAALLFSNVVRYLWFVHVDNEPTGYSGLYRVLVSDIGETWAAPIGFLLLYLGMLGVLVLFYPLFLFLQRRVEKLHPLHWFPLVLAGVAGMIIIWAPASSNGDQFEFKHRAFVLLYVTTLIWTCDLVVRFVYRKFSGAVAPAIVFLPVFFCTLFALSWSGQFMTVDRPKFLWGQQYVDTPVPKDLIATADFVRRHGRRGDVAIFHPIDVRARAADNSTRFASIANVPLYLSRFTMWEPSLAQSRLLMVKTVISRSTVAEAEMMMQTNGFRWLVMSNKLAPAFDPDFSRAAFKQGDWAVYRFN
jgi:hypothetical protein